MNKASILLSHRLRRLRGERYPVDIGSEPTEAERRLDSLFFLSYVTVKAKQMGKYASPSVYYRIWTLHFNSSFSSLCVTYNKTLISAIYAPHIISLCLAPVNNNYDNTGNQCNKYRSYTSFYSKANIIEESAFC